MYRFISKLLGHCYAIYNIGSWGARQVKLRTICPNITLITILLSTHAAQTIGASVRTLLKNTFSIFQ